MPEFHVAVEKKLTSRGILKVIADTPQAAVNKVRDRINTGTLQTTEIEWSTPEYEDDSLKCYGEVI